MPIQGGRKAMDPVLKNAMTGNLSWWEEATPVHIRSYESIERLRAGQPVLDDIQLSEMGPVAGKTLLHLMCHIGTDSLAWAREGAVVTGVDFSPSALRFAREFSAELGIPASFIESNIYEVEQKLNARFDVVYTSMGVLSWLPDLKEWARIAAGYLKPGGQFYLMDTHPLLWTFEDMRPGAPLSIVRSYFHHQAPTVFNDDKPDYADAAFVNRKPSYEWTWSVSDILNALIGAGLVIESFNEHDTLFYPHFSDMVQNEKGWWYHPSYRGMLPCSFSLRATMGLRY